MALKGRKTHGFLLNKRLILIIHKYNNILCPDRYDINIKFKYFLNNTYAVEFHAADKQMYMV